MLWPRLLRFADASNNDITQPKELFFCFFYIERQHMKKLTTFFFLMASLTLKAQDETIRKLNADASRTITKEKDTC